MQKTITEHRQENETAAPDNETVPETTAPFIPSSPLDDIYIPVGPGYM